MEEINTLQRRGMRMTHAQAGEINGKVPPQAPELEMSVLGALMLDKDALYGVIDKLHEGLFYKTEHQAIYAAIRMLVGAGKVVDILTVVEALRKEGKLEQAGGAFYVSQLTSHVASAAHLEYHISILAERFIQREVIRTSTESIREAYDDTCDAIELLDKSQKKLMEVSEKSFKKEGVSLEAILTEMQQTLLSKDPENYGILSGFVELDRLTSGFKPGTLIILAARPGMGKTACGLNMARNIAVDFKKPVAFFSLEMTGVELAMRLLLSESMIDSKKLQHPDSLTDDERARICDTIKELNSAPIYIDDTAGINIFELRSKCRRLQQRYGIKMVFLDYLQLMGSVNDGNRTRNREQELAIISRQLKEMSKELNIPVLAMAQFNRKVDDRPMQIPLLSDLRESGSIEQDADMVIAIHRLEACGIEQDDMGNSTHGQATLRVLKHRAGEKKTIEIRFDDRYMKFYDKPQNVVYDSKINIDVVNMGDASQPAREMDVDNDGNPVFPDSGIPPINDTTAPPILPPSYPPLQYPFNQMPPEGNALFS